MIIIQRVRPKKNNYLGLSYIRFAGKSPINRVDAHNTLIDVKKLKRTYADKYDQVHL